MQKIFDHFKTNAGIWTFGLFMAAVAGGIYQFTIFMVSAQVTPVEARLDTQVERLDAADGNTNRTITDIAKFMNAHFEQLRRAIGQNTDKIILLDRKLEKKIEVLDQKIEKKFDQLNEKFDSKITMLDQKIDRQIGLLDQKIEKKFDQLDQKISRLDEKMDKKFNLILLRLPPLKK